MSIQMTDVSTANSDVYSVRNAVMPNSNVLSTFSSCIFSELSSIVEEDKDEVEDEEAEKKAKAEAMKTIYVRYPKIYTKVFQIMMKENDLMELKKHKQDWMLMNAISRVTTMAALKKKTALLKERRKRRFKDPYAHLKTKRRSSLPPYKDMEDDWIIFELVDPVVLNMRMQAVMGSNLMKLNDEFLSTLYKRIRKKENAEINARLVSRKMTERARLKKLILDGKAEMTEEYKDSLKDVRGHPLFTANRLIERINIYGQKFSAPPKFMKESMNPVEPCEFDIAKFFRHLDHTGRKWRPTEEELRRCIKLKRDNNKIRKKEIKKKKKSCHELPNEKDKAACNSDFLGEHDEVEIGESKSDISPIGSGIVRRRKTLIETLPDTDEEIDEKETYLKILMGHTIEAEKEFEKDYISVKKLYANLDELNETMKQRSLDAAKMQKFLTDKCNTPPFRRQKKIFATMKQETGIQSLDNCKPFKDPLIKKYIDDVKNPDTMITNFTKIHNLLERSQLVANEFTQKLGGMIIATLKPPMD